MAHRQGRAVKIEGLGTYTPSIDTGGDLDIAQSVVAIKGLLERLREQVQNIE